MSVDQCRRQEYRPRSQESEDDVGVQVNRAAVVVRGDEALNVFAEYQRQAGSTIASGCRERSQVDDRGQRGAEDRRTGPKESSSG